MLRLKTTTDKQIQAAGVLARLEGGRIDRMRLLKLLYIADRESLAERGSPIIGGRVVAMDNGPLHSEVYSLIKGEHEDDAAWSRFFTNDGHVTVLRDDPGRLELSPFETEKLTEVSDRMRSVDTWQVAEETHKFAERLACHVAGTSRTIPLEKILESLGFSQDDIGHIRLEAESHRRAMRSMLCG